MSYMTRMASTTLAVDSATIDFASIPATFTHLLMVFSIRGASELVALSLNGSSTNANYDRQYISARATSVQAASVLGGNGSRDIGLGATTSAPTNHFGTGKIFFPYYANTTTYKSALSFNGKWDARTSTQLLLRRYVVGWASTAAINQITLSANGPNYSAGSRVALYGIG